MLYGHLNRRYYSNFLNASQLNRTMDQEPEISQISQAHQQYHLLDHSAQQQLSFEGYLANEITHNTYTIIKPLQLLSRDEAYLKIYSNNDIIKPLLQSGPSALMQFAKSVYKNQCQWFEAQDLTHLNQMLLTDSDIQTCSAHSLKIKITKRSLLNSSQSKQMQEYDDDLLDKSIKYPLYRDNFLKIKLELFCRNLKMSPDAKYSNRLLASLLIFQVGQNYKNIFNQTKIIIKDLIQNRSTKFLEKYIQYAYEYKQYFNNQIAEVEQKKYNNQINQDIINEMLIKGIAESIMILMPDKEVYGFTLNQTICCNLYPYLVKRRIPVEFQGDSKDLLRTLICLTILHQLSHFIVRQLGFILENDRSFTNKQTITDLPRKFKSINSFLFNEKIVSIKVAKFVLDYQDKLKNLSLQLKKQKVSEKFHSIENKMFWLIVHNSIATLVTAQQFNKFYTELQKLLSSELLTNTNIEPTNFKDLIQLQIIIFQIMKTIQSQDIDSQQQFLVILSCSS